MRTRHEIDESHKHIKKRVNNELKLHEAREGDMEEYIAKIHKKSAMPIRENTLLR